MFEKKRIGDWTLLETERSSFFTQYAERCEIGSDYYLNYNKNVWEHFIFPSLRETNSPKRIAIDIGASYGFMSEGFTNHFEHVHAFELITPIRECLVENLGHLSNLTIHEHGLGPAEDMVRSYFYPLYTGHCSLVDLQLKSPREKVVCTIKPLDSYGLTDVDFIKLDVEGYELEVLKGAVNTLKNNSPLVMIEVLSTNNNAMSNAIKIGEFMGSLGYKFMLKHNEDFLFSKEV